MLALKQMPHLSPLSVPTTTIRPPPTTRLLSAITKNCLGKLFCFGASHVSSDDNTDGCIFGASRYMGQYTTPVTAVLEAYVLISFLIFFVMFMLCVHRHGCCVSISFTSFLFSICCSPFLYVWVTDLENTAHLSPQKTSSSSKSCAVSTADASQGL